MHLAVLGILAAILTASGCGGSSKTDSTVTATTTARTPRDTVTSAATVAAIKNAGIVKATVKLDSGKPLTRAQWIAKAEAICTELNRKSYATAVKSTAEFPRALTQSGAYERAALAQFVKLVPPPAYTSDWQQFTDATQQIIDNTAMLLKSPPGTITLRSPIIIGSTKLYADRSQIARHDGFKECAND